MSTISNSSHALLFVLPLADKIPIKSPLFACLQLQLKISRVNYLTPSKKNDEDYYLFVSLPPLALFGTRHYSKEMQIASH